MDKNLLDDPDRWAWHAYDYGWRRVYISNRDPSSPIDPEGVWYDPRLADQAEAMYAAKTNRRQR